MIPKLKQRDVSDLTPAERKRIVAGWGQVSDGGPYWEGLRVIGACFNIHEDTVGLVLSEEGMNERS